MAARGEIHGGAATTPMAEFDPVVDFPARPPAFFHSPVSQCDRSRQRHRVPLVDIFRGIPGFSKIHFVKKIVPDNSFIAPAEGFDGRFRGLVVDTKNEGIGVANAGILRGEALLAEVQEVWSIKIPDEPHEVGVHDLQSDCGRKIGEFVVSVNLSAPTVIGDNGERAARQAACLESQSQPLLCLQKIFFEADRIQKTTESFWLSDLKYWILEQRNARILGKPQHRPT